MNEQAIKIIISILVSIPILTIIHLLGIAFFGVVFGGKVDKFVLGTGKKKLISIGAFEIRNSYPMTGECTVRQHKLSNNLKRIIFALSGLIFLFVTGCSMAILMLTGIIKRDIIFINTVIFSFFLIVSHLVPANPASGWGAVGRQIQDIIRFSRLDELAKDEKTMPLFLKEMNDRILALRDESIVFQYEHIRVKYLGMTQYKAMKLYNLGRIEEALETLESVEVEVIKHSPLAMILYYNDILFKKVESGRFENIDELYNKLTSLLAVEENKKYFNNSIKDTIATYEYYRGDKEKSEKLFKEVLESESYSSKFTGGLYHLSKIYFEKGQYSEAEKMLNYIDMKDVHDVLREKIDSFRNILASTCENKTI